MYLSTVALDAEMRGMDSQPNSALAEPYIFPGFPLSFVDSTANTTTPLIGRPLSAWERVTREVLAERGELWARLAKL